MKRCPNCSAQINDDSFFCTECGKPIPQGNVCSHCGSPINDGDAFCQSCGRKVDESPSTEDSTQKKCAHCGSPINDDDAFCQSCGSPLNGVTISQTTAQVTLSCDEEEAPTDYKKIIIPIVIGLIVLILIGGGWYGYKEYSAYRAKKEAREEFVADSLEKVRQDSIKLAAKLEAERIEKEKIERFRENFTFNNILNLLKHPDDASLAQKCGLSLLYKNSETIVDNFMEEGDSYKAYDIAYGYETEKGSKNSEGLGYGIKASSTHSCYFNYLAGRGKTAFFYFKDESDADYLFEMAKDYGLIECCNSYFIPRKKVAIGITHVDEYDSESEALYDIRQLGEMDGWYWLEIGMIGQE